MAHAMPLRGRWYDVRRAAAERQDVRRPAIAWRSMLEFSGQIDRKLYIRALRQQGKGLIAIAVMLIAAGVWGLRSARMEEPASWGGALFVTLLGAFLIAAPYLTAQKALSTSAILRSPFKGTVDETHIVFESSYGRSDLPGPALHRAAIGPNLALLYSSAHQFHILSREFFADDSAWKAFCELASKYAPKFSEHRTVFKTTIVWLAIVVTVFIVWWLLESPAP
jgi:hypothetical protein